MLDTSTDTLETATVDGDLVVSVTGTLHVGRSGYVTYACSIRHDGVWASQGGWQVPVVVTNGP